MILCCALAFAAPADDLAAANAALAAGDLPAAEAGYRGLLQSGANTGDVWFNLGNVLYREGKVAEAVHAWRTAAVRLPRDPDIQANLDFARPKLRDGLVAPVPHPWFAPWQVALTVEEAIWLGAATAGMGLLAIGLRGRWVHGPLLPAGVAAVGLGTLVAAGGWAADGLAPVAVVVAPEVTATSDLGGGVNLFTLHAGAEVQTEEVEAGRTLVVLPDGRRGWIPDTAVAVVDTKPATPVL